MSIGISDENSRLGCSRLFPPARSKPPPVGGGGGGEPTVMVIIWVGTAVVSCGDGVALWWYGMILPMNEADNYGVVLTMIF